MTLRKLKYTVKVTVIVLVISHCSQRESKQHTDRIDLSTVQIFDSLMAKIELVRAQRLEPDQYDSIVAVNQMHNVNTVNDSLMILNYQLVVFFKKHIQKLNKHVLSLFATGNRVRLCADPDSVIIGCTWPIDYSSTIPYYNNVLICISERRNLFYHYSGFDSLGRQFGENVKIDTIIRVTGKQNNYFLFMVTNQCSAACVNSHIHSFRLAGDNIIRGECVFMRGDSCYKEIGMKYFINTNIPKKLIFEVERNELVLPMIDETRANIKGYTKYSLVD